MSQVKKASQLKIKLATSDDSEVIAELIRAAFAPFESQYTAGAFEYVTPTADLVRPRFEEGPLWIAELNGEPAGTVSGIPEDGRFYMRSMAVKPMAQRVGIGQKLVDAFESYARENGFEKMFLYTTFVLPGATQLYEKNGFYVVRETPPDEWFGMAGLEMEKKI